MIGQAEPSQGLSTRKLLIETAKHNVLTAYNGREGLEMASHHRLDVVVIDSRLHDMRCEAVASQIKKLLENCPVIALATEDAVPRSVCPGADHVVPAGDPARLLQLLESLGLNTYIE